MGHKNDKIMTEINRVKRYDENLLKGVLSAVH